MSRKPSIWFITALFVCAVATTGLAQTPEPGNTVLIAEFECDPAELAKVDDLMKNVTAPVLNKYVREGKLIGWGVLGAYVGGPSNRAVYVWAKDPVSLLQARAEYLPEIVAKPGWSELVRLCPRQQVRINNMLMRAEAGQ